MSKDLPSMNKFCDWLSETIVTSVYGSFFRNYISAHPFISKLQKAKPLLIWTRFLKKYFRGYKHATGNFLLNSMMT